MIRHFYVGVDGGATKCTVRLEDEHGTLLGRETGGPASLRFSTAEVWQAIFSALNNLLQQQGLSLHDPQTYFHAGLGLAGSEITAAYHSFINSAHPFKTCQVTSDAHTACLGAHGAADGAIIIAGTGVVGYQIHRHKTVKIGGFGFPHDDDGGGAWLGLQAIRTTVQAEDGRVAKSTLSHAVMQHFDQDVGALTAWANSANATAFASLAPLVINASQQQDDVACDLLKQAARAIDMIAQALERAQIDNSKPLPVALVGGVARFLTPYLSEALRERLVTVSAPPDAGAVLLARSGHAR